MLLGWISLPLGRFAGGGAVAGERLTLSSSLGLF